MLKRAQDLRVLVLSVLVCVAMMTTAGIAQTSARPPAKAAGKTAKTAAKPAATSAASAASAPIDSDTFGGYEARAIGPAQTGGRVADIDAVHEGQKLTIYAG